MRSDPTRPALRPLDVVPFNDGEGQTRFALHDQAGISPQSVSVSLPGYFVLAHLDGAHTVADIEEAFERQFGTKLPAEQILRLIEALDDAVMLDNERFNMIYAEHVAAYRAAAARDNRAQWPDADSLRGELEQILNVGGAPPMREVAGIIAPHLDYARGGPCYSDAYAVLDEAEPATRFVILGTNHAGRSHGVVATTKDFLTPLGQVQTDRAFIAELERWLGTGLCEHELDHLREHSIELQVHMLQVCQPRPAFTIVPVLCPDPCGPTGTSPLDGNGPSLEEFGDALGELARESDGRTVIIAGADLSHVGQRFGDPVPGTPEFLAVVEKGDRALLDALEQRRDADFLTTVRASENVTRVCSVGCIYTLLRALPGRACHVLRYHQAVDFEAETHVTCAAAVFG
ncbi:MAG: AmmeMemoRadiSam system protein B [Phycisphaerae bacterium]|nr:AmmeMemoRadiSam system protein B [Phycisphaerae bacterium]